MTIVLALDQSTTLTGWAVGRLDTTRPQVLSSGTFKAEGTNWIARLEHLSDWLLDVSGDASVIAYEIPTHSHGMKTSRRLGAAEYVVLQAARYNQCHAWGFTASQVTATGFGKRHIDTTARSLGHTPDADEADAAAIFFLAWQAHGGRVNPAEQY